MMQGAQAAAANDGTALGVAIRRVEDLVAATEPGDSLPGENELAEGLSISRLTVREALKVLSGRGLVQLSRGRRPTVRSRDSGVLAHYLAVTLRRDSRGLLELNEVRQSLEGLSAELAARNAGRAALSALAGSLSELERAAVLVEASAKADQAALAAYHRADVAFHETLALASGNRMLAFLLEALGECLHTSVESAGQGHFARGGTTAEVVADHRRILDAVRAGDARLARSAMQQHLRRAERDLHLALGSLTTAPAANQTGATATRGDMT